MKKSSLKSITHHPSSKNQQGIALVVAILVIGIVVLIVMAISQMMTTEFKLVGSLDRSVLAYYASESGIEDALLQYKESGGDLDLISVGDPVCFDSPTDNICYTVTVDEPENRIYSTGTAYGVVRKLEVEPPSPPYTGPTNLIDEAAGVEGVGSFEVDTNPADGFPDYWLSWYEYGLGPPWINWEMDSSGDNPDGEYSIKFTSDTTEDYLQSIDFSVDNTKSYTAALKVKLENTWIFNAEVQCFDINNAWVGSRYIAQFNLPPNSDWTPYSIILSGQGSEDGQFPTGTVRVYILIYIQPNAALSPSYCWIDNVQFYEN